jgi:hypothetical protein
MKRVVEALIPAEPLAARHLTCLDWRVEQDRGLWSELEMVTQGAERHGLAAVTTSATQSLPVLRLLWAALACEILDFGGA